jgi:uncharacterized protein
MKCGGACEYTKIAGLLPGEERYIAEKLNLSLEEFIYSYLDGVKVDEHIINIIRCSNPCPFLKNDYSCAIKEFKPVLCLIYPIIFKPDGSGRKLELDYSCPLAQNREAERYFKNTGIKLASQLYVPGDWIEDIYKFDDFDYDYKKIVKERDMSLNRYKLYTLKNLLSYRKEDEC